MTKYFTWKTSLAITLITLSSASANADQVINDDQIVVGSLCVGFDCVNGESFGFDTLRLKENNLRINFQDTSSSASFPTNDWRIIINDSSNGGGNYFGIEDSTAGRIPFRVEAGARSNSLYVENGGDVGFGTNNPVVELHTRDGDTPTLRLEQDGSSGFTPQSWDMAGNETNFFIRDVTNSSQLPFRIKPGSATNSLYVHPDGVGIGTANPEAKLHVEGAGYFKASVGISTSTPDAKLHIAHTDAATEIGQDGHVHIEGNAMIDGTLITSQYVDVDATIADLLTKIGDLEAANTTLQSSNTNLSNRLQAIEDLLGL